MTHCGRNLILAIILIMIVSSKVSNTVQFIVRLKADEPLITIVAVMLLFFYLITFFAYFKVYRIIRKHRQQIQKNQSSQNFGRLAINLPQRSAHSYVSSPYFPSLYFPADVAVAAFFFDEREYFFLGDVCCTPYCFCHLFLSPSLNPALYVSRMNGIRNEVKHLFR